jgi:hypothetical protein
MSTKNKKTISILLLLIILLFDSSFLKTFPNNLTNLNNRNYEAIVLGNLIKKKVFKRGDFYLTQYKFKPKKWFYKKEKVAQKKYLKINVFGADLEKEGLLIKASTTPDHMPLNEDVILFLEETMSKKKNLFTISRDGIISGDSVCKFKWEKK